MKKRFDTLNYKVDRLLPKGKNKKVPGLMKDELEGKTMTEVVAPRPKAYSYLKYNGNEDKKSKRNKKKCVIERELKFKYYENYNKANQIYNMIKHFLKNETDTDSLKKEYEKFIKKQ